MKKILVSSLIYLIFIIVLSGCSLIEAEEGEHRERLNAEAWPTPEQEAAASTPTPFPQVTLAPPAAPSPAAARPTATPAVVSAEVTPAGQEGVAVGMGDSGTALIEQIRSLGGGAALPSGLIPVGVAVVAVDQAAIYQGPATSYGTLQVLEKGELAGILGKDNSGSWVYAITIKKTLGWLHVGSLRITGNLAETPVLPPNPLAAFMAQLGAAANTGETASTKGPAPVQPLALDELTPVTTAQVKSDLLNIRQRPGGDYKQLFTLPQTTEVAVLALNRDGKWALVAAAGQRIGWAAVDFLSFSGSLAGAPRVRTLEPAAADEVAPVVALSGNAGPVAVAENSTVDNAVAVNNTPNNNPVSGSPPAIAPVAANDPPAIPDNTLAPVAAGRVNTKLDSRRGPANSYGPVDELTIDEPVEILAQNEQKDWVVVRTPTGSVGWVPLEAITVEEESPANAPQVVTAWVESNETQIRRGPGIYYEVAGVLPIHDLVSVLALDKGRSWALVEALNGGQGWIPLRLIDITGSLDNVPEIDSPALAENSPAGQSLPASNPAGVTTGKLVFQTSSGGDIMLINADGTGLRRLTKGIDPVLSPDGQQVAFTRWVGDIGELWLINVDGTNERQILGQMTKAKGPDWSPDGSQIVLNFQYGGRLDEKEVCRPLGSSSTPPRNAVRIWVRTDDSGRAVALCWTLAPDPHWGLRSINLADGSFNDFYGGTYAFRPAWDPGQPWRIVSDSGNGLLGVNVDQKDYRQALTDVVGDSSPVFSPDGRFIALSTQMQNAYDIFRLNSDGSGRVRLTETPLWVPVQPENNGELWNNVAPTWSPGGASIAFLTDREGRWEIWVMNADGSNQRPLFSTEINNQLKISYDFVDERVLSWR